MVTSIGSLPFLDVDRSIDLIFACCPEVPFWPQLPRRSFLEGMYAQWLEGVPTVVIDREAGTVHVDTRLTDGIEVFYENVQAGNIEAFAASDLAAPGFYRFLERIPEIGDKVKVIKGQLTGPFTAGLGLKDENGKPVIYDNAYFDIIKKALHMKARWMLKTIKERYPEKEVMLFLDEPAMVSFGSAFVSVSRDEVISHINDVADGLDATIGVHCCGNTDWSVLLNSRIDIINYDAFNFMETIFYFDRDLSAFIERGGLISPGIVPSGDDELNTATAAHIEDLLTRFCDRFLPFTHQKKNIVVTTSCGLGSLTESSAVKALELLSTLS